MLVNVLWPFVPAAIILHAFPGLHITKFAISYIAVVPSANLLGFAGQEFARKMPKVAGILLETTFGSIIEIILFVVLIAKHDNESVGNGDEGNMLPIIQAAILGSILTNLLLCLGLCFFFGGLRQATQKFHAIVSEVGTGLLLVAAFGLLIPSAFYSALKSETVAPRLRVLHEEFTKRKLQSDVLHISRATAIALIVAFLFYIWFQTRSQHSIFDEVIEMDEHRDLDRGQDLEKPKFTMTEALIAITFSLVVVTILLIFLVAQIEHVVETGLPDQFLGLVSLFPTLYLIDYQTLTKLLTDSTSSCRKGRRASNRYRRGLGRRHQRRTLPLSRPFYPDRPFQCPLRGPYRLGSGKAARPQL